jgi:proteic killer suppression protein
MTVSRFRNIERVARRKLLQIRAATELGSLRVPPGNQLEALRADRKGQHGIRINDRWRTGKSGPGSCPGSASFSR